ncbi:hypothetical protein [Photobacterium sp. TY1-4]|uniref:hypothetical protein n=1 Tax=Photobacterium sp. TY1-4 TaxID=2899122 RepID=UPI0021BFFF32|nr:hypothetical protein [Photobacterium sp. TY1-4]UXI00135.1 hypothetical protein NH461_09895 [Photobacterium sp. TY1-4]
MKLNKVTLSLLAVCIGYSGVAASENYVSSDSVYDGDTYTKHEVSGDETTSYDDTTDDTTDDTSDDYDTGDDTSDDMTGGYGYQDDTTDDTSDDYDTGDDTSDDMTGGYGYEDDTTDDTSDDYDTGDDTSDDMTDGYGYQDDTTDDTSDDYDTGDDTSDDMTDGYGYEDDATDDTSDDYDTGDDTSDDMTDGYGYEDDTTDDTSDDYDTGDDTSDDMTDDYGYEDDTTDDNTDDTSDGYDTDDGTGDDAEKQRLALNVVGAGEMYEMDVPDIDGDGQPDPAYCFDVELKNIADGELVGTATDCLSNLEPGENGGQKLVGTTIFNLSDGQIITRGQTTIQPVNELTVSPDGEDITHITGASSDENSVIETSGDYEGHQGTVRRSGMLNFSEFTNGVGDPMYFDCLFIIELVEVSMSPNRSEKWSHRYHYDWKHRSYKKHHSN